jgi:putative ABC transport system ATP-binding protein
MDIVQIKNLNKEYTLDRNILPVLKNVNLTVAQGEFLALAGPSGSGKTTLLNLIGCIDQPSAGQVFIGGQETSTLTDDQLADIRIEKIGFIFQNFNLFPVLTALENVEYAIAHQKIPSVAKRKKATEALSVVGLEKFANHRPLQLSGGQQQRVAIARAMVRDPLLILADEPTANLDHKTGEEILQLMVQSNKEKNVTFIFSTHDQKVMEKAKRVVKIWDGEIIP